MQSESQSQEPIGDLGGLRREITELIARNAVTMIQNTIDAINEGGQYQALKYLFEMIGLYPPAANEEQPGEESLAATLLHHLGFDEATRADSPDGKGQSSPPVE